MHTNQYIEKIAFTVVQIKSLAMLITNQKCILIYIHSGKFTKYIQGTLSLLNILIIFWHKRKIYNFDPYNVLLAIATNIFV